MFQPLFIIQEWLVLNSFSWLWVLVALFGPAFLSFIGAQVLRVDGDKAHYVCPVYALCMRIHDVWALSQIKSGRRARQHLYNNTKSTATFFFSSTVATMGVRCRRGIASFGTFGAIRGSHVAQQ